MSPELTAGTGGDALAHAVDGFMAPRADELNQAVALKAIEMVFEWLPKAVHDGNDLMPRMKMQQAAMMAGIPLSNAGSGISHALGHTIGDCSTFIMHYGFIVLPMSFRFIQKRLTGTRDLRLDGLPTRLDEKSPPASSGKLHPDDKGKPAHQSQAGVR
jgi:alcohol dehydrogenase class IV